ncbi:MAG TPA: hypothetical protein VFY45_01495 [Baekduia sp.]|nr:hypothetical protein [Baekduia sp.]
MSLRTPALLATLATLVMLGAGPGTAAANVWGHAGTTTGNQLAASTNLDAVLKPTTSATINSPTGVITCTAASLRATTGVNGGATVALAVSTFSLTSCTDTLPAANVTSCTFYNDPNNSVSMATGATASTMGMVTSIPMPTTQTVVCNPGVATTPCYVRINNQSGTATYTFDGAGNISASELAYAAVPAIKPMAPISPTGCPPSTNLTVTVAFSSLKVLSNSVLVGFNNVM